jgi:hypothetical protein
MKTHIPLKLYFAATSGVCLIRAHLRRCWVFTKKLQIRKKKSPHDPQLSVSHKTAAYFKAVPRTPIQLDVYDDFEHDRAMRAPADRTAFENAYALPKMIPTFPFTTLILPNLQPWSRDGREDGAIDGQSGPTF